MPWSRHPTPDPPGGDRCRGYAGRLISPADHQAVDLLGEEQRRALRYRHPRAIQISALTGEGLDELCEAIEVEFRKTLRPLDLLVPYEEGARLSELHELAGELELRHRQ